MKKVNVSEFLKKDEELRNQVKEMRNHIFGEMKAILTEHGGEIRFEAVPQPNDNYRLVKGFRVNGDKVQYLSELKDKPKVFSHNPYGIWCDIQRGYGFKTIRILLENLEILRQAERK